MKLHIISDIHLEFDNMDIPNPDSDISIIAGDLHNRNPRSKVGKET